MPLAEPSAPAVTSGPSLVDCCLVAFVVAVEGCPGAAVTLHRLRNAIDNYVASVEKVAAKEYAARLGVVETKLAVGQKSSERIGTDVKATSARSHKRESLTSHRLGE